MANTFYFLIFCLLSFNTNSLNQADFDLSLEHTRIFACNFYSDQYFKSQNFKNLIEEIKYEIRQVAGNYHDTVIQNRARNLDSNIVEKTTQNLVITECLIKSKIDEFHNVHDIFMNSHMMDIENIHRESNTMFMKKNTLEYLFNRDNHNNFNNQDIFFDQINDFREQFKNMVKMKNEMNNYIHNQYNVEQKNDVHLMETHFKNYVISYHILGLFCCLIIFYLCIYWLKNEYLLSVNQDSISII